MLRALGGAATRASLSPTCQCDAGSEPGLVLDPFMGSGTTAIAAEQQQREWLGVELNPVYAALAEQRLGMARGRSLKRKEVQRA